MRLADENTLKGGIFGAVLVVISVAASVGVNYGSFATRLNTVERQVQQVKPNEIQLQVLSAQLKEVNRRLQQIEGKLDTLNSKGN